MVWQKVTEDSDTWTPKDAGDQIEGVFMGMEASSVHAGSWLVDLSVGENESKGIWANKVLYARLKKIAIGEKVRITFTGWAGKKVNDYRLFDVEVDRDE